jgi:hypothetical protein
VRVDARVAQPAKLRRGEARDDEDQEYGNEIRSLIGGGSILAPRNAEGQLSSIPCDTIQSAACVVEAGLQTRR